MAAVKSEQTDPFQKHIELDSAINAVQANIRPRLYDKGNKIHRLVDTGSMISTTAKQKGDKLNENLVLQAFNNTPMKTYSFRTVEVKIGRKTYPIEAVIVDLPQEILG